MEAKDIQIAVSTMMTRLSENETFHEVNGNSKEQLLKMSKIDSNSFVDKIGPYPVPPLDMKAEPTNTYGDFSAYLKGSPILQNIIEVGAPTDVILSLSNGKLGAHGIVLAASSPFLRSMLQDEVIFYKSSQTVTFILPDISVETMKILLNMAYTGKMTYSKEEEQDVFDAMTLLYFAEFANLSLEELETPKRKKEASPTPSSSRVLSDVTTTKTANEGGKHNQENKRNGTSAASNPNKKIKHGSSSSKNDSSIRVRRETCSSCKGSFRSMANLLTHMEKKHKEAWLKFRASEEELQCLTFCNYCGNQLKSIQVANKCLNKHSMIRCYICFDAVKKTDILEHYESFHTDSIKMRKQAIAKCRWCSKLIRYDHHGRYILQHCTRLHIQENHVKKGAASNERSEINDTEEADNIQLSRFKEFMKPLVVLHRLTDIELKKLSKPEPDIPVNGCTDNLNSSSLNANIKYADVNNEGEFGKSTLDENMESNPDYPGAEEIGHEIVIENFEKKVDMDLITANSNEFTNAINEQESIDEQESNESIDVDGMDDGTTESEPEDETVGASYKMAKGNENEVQTEIMNYEIVNMPAMHNGIVEEENSMRRSLPLFLGSERHSNYDYEKVSRPTSPAVNIERKVKESTSTNRIGKSIQSARKSKLQKGKQLAVELHSKIQELGEGDELMDCSDNSDGIYGIYGQQPSPISLDLCNSPKTKCSLFEFVQDGSRLAAINNGSNVGSMETTGQTDVDFNKFVKSEIGTNLHCQEI